jgi:hypothetical protein
MNALYKLLSVLGTLKAASRGPGALGRRVARQQANKQFNRALRKVVKP